MGLLSSLRGKQGDNAIQQSTTTATMLLLEQNRRFEAFMREKVATLERQVAEDDGRLNNDKSGEEDSFSETDSAGDLEADGPGEGQDIDAGFSAEAEHEGIAIIGEEFGELEEELGPPAVTPSAHPAEPVQPPPSPKASSEPPDWRSFLAGASAAVSPGMPAAGEGKPPADGGGQADAQGEDAAEEEDLVEAGADQPPTGEIGQDDAQGEDAAEEEDLVEAEADQPPTGEIGQDDAQGEDAAEEEEGLDDGGLFAMVLPIVSVNRATEERERPPSSSATAPATAVPPAPPAAAEEERPPQPKSDVATPGPDAADQSAGEWEQDGLHDGQVGSWA